MALRLLSSKSVAARLDVSVKTVLRLVKEGKFPDPAMTMPGGGHRWYEHDVEIWLAGQRITPPVKSK